MKFSDIEREGWPELQPYIDTVLLPLSGLSGRESPWETTAALEQLRDALDPIEAAYKGRVVTYPAVHYAEDDEALAALADKLCSRLSESGFTYCVLVTAQERLLRLSVANASALIGPEETTDPAAKRSAYRHRAKEIIESLWSQPRHASQTTSIEL
jgi:23S rRNA (pseudouridine1915-N3)-methyltransferase